MKNSKSITLTNLDYSSINTQQYINEAHKLRGVAIAEHFGVIKNVFKKKSSHVKFKK